MSGVACLHDVLSIEAEGPPRTWPENTYDLLRQGKRIDPDAPALSFFLRVQDHALPETWSYRRLFADVTRAANLFHGLGARKDTVIAFILPNLPETHFVIWGGEAAGIVAPINPLLEPDAFVDLLNATGASILVTLAPFPGVDLWGKVRDVLPRVPAIRHLVLVNLADRVRGWRHIAARWVQRRAVRTQAGPAGLAGAVPSSVQVHDFGTLMQRQPGDRLVSGRRIRPEDASSFFCTGGTTGVPKIAMRRHGAEVANAWAVARFMGNGFGTGKTIFCGLPLFHVNAVMVTGLSPFSQGAHVVLGTPQGYRGDGLIGRFWEIVERHRINFFSGVPTLYAALLQVPIDGRRIDSLEYGLCGAAPMPVQLFRDFQARTGLKILEGYGLTEATCVSSVNPPSGDRRVGSIGLRLPGQLMKAVHLDENGRYLRDCGVDEVGLLVVSGPNVFDGYRRAEQNVGLWIDLDDGRRWLNTGDLARQDADGYFWLTGRKKDLIIRGGHNIDPAVIEDALHSHPAVQLAAAIGRPDIHAGELPVVYVQPRAGITVMPGELLAFAQSAISERAAVPKEVCIIDQMPLTPVGKVFKPALKRREILHVAERLLAGAGLKPSMLEVVDDPGRGMVIKVVAADTASRDGIRDSLGQLAFPCDVSVQR
ncbi:acyl-CoA synthetase [Niveispirillum sp.]|uniref:acyl-CoA synthetase n=1 Tax=Niveispirillum sp. TaxID=1917217 RepID=UPI001B67F3E6|nr:acyl-CoA synthetase [Niveispirillum sp.]MBP7338622.1 acyl-CoA synthetase [Niveispirillum sp.]